MSKHPVRQTGEDSDDPESWTVDGSPKKEAEKQPERKPKK